MQSAKTPVHLANAGQDEAARSDVPHFALRAAPRENAEDADLLSCLAISAAIYRGVKCLTLKLPENS